MDGSARVRVRLAGIHWREIEGEVLLLDSNTQRYLALNRSGMVLWELLTRGATRTELAQRLATEYGLDAERASADVESLIDQLADHDLLAAPGLVDLDRLESNTFAPLVGQTFTLAAAGGEQFDVVLSSCTASPGAAAGAGRAPFSLILHAPGRQLVRQQVCTFSHPALGQLELFAVPLGPDERGMRYEVIFG